jgi:hypothetical protein
MTMTTMNKVKLIYMQQTIDAMHAKDPNLLFELNQYGEPEPVELVDKEGETTHKYYMYQL